MMRTKIWSFALAAFAIAGCATSTGVMSLGSDTYRTSATAAPVRGGSSEAERIALDDARKFCEARGRQILVIDLNARATNIYGAGAADATFRCVSDASAQGGASLAVGDIIAQNLVTGAVYRGTTTTVPGTTRAAVWMTPFGADHPECRGQSAITSLTPGFSGSLGAVRLLCSDGRTVTADFTYENQSRGFGVGRDDVGEKYRFIFGYGASDIAVAKRLIEDKFEEAQKNATSGKGAAKAVGY